MKKIGLVAIFGLFLGTQVVYSQTDNPENQTFSVEKFQIKTPTNLSEKIRLTAKFDIVMGHPLESYYTSKYNLHYSLSSADGKILAEGMLDKYLTARADFSREDVAIEKDLEIQVPYATLSLPAGKHDLVLEIWTSYLRKAFPKCLKKTITVSMPELYNYADQKFTVKNFGIKSDVLFKGILGLEASFDVSYLFTAEQIRELYQSMDFRYFAYTILLKDAKTGNSVALFKPESSTQSESSEKLFEFVKIHIPYNQINLPEGTHQLKAELIISGYARRIVFGKHAEKAFEYSQPAVYLASFTLNNLTAEEKQYDSSNAFGRLFSKPSSNVGKGYPDLYWIVETGAYTVYESARNKNSFSAITGETRFTTVDSDPIFLAAYDYDSFNVNDLIGVFKIPHTAGNYSLSKQNFVFPGVTTSNFEFKKTRYPSVLNESFSAKPCKNGGVSGFCVEGYFSVSELPAGEQISVTPIQLLGEKNSDVSGFINLETGEKNLNFTSAQAGLNLFYPFYTVKNAQKIGVNLKLATLGFPVGDVLVGDAVSIPNFDDTNLIINILENQKDETGLVGIRIETNAVVPDAYWNLGRVSSKLKLNFTQNPTLNLDTLIYPAKTGTDAVFIPYYKLEKGENQEIQISEETFSDKDFRIGVNTEKLTFVNAKLTFVQIKKIDIKLSKDQTATKLSYQIMHGKNVIAEGDAPVSGGVVRITCSMSMNLVHPSDVLSLEFSEKDTYGIAAKWGEAKFTASDFKKGKLKLKKPMNGIKKVQIFED